jgi:tRNA-dihydrouridine synthase
MRSLLPESRPVLALAPMQDITDLPFMRVMEKFGGPDYYVTEYFRVHENSSLCKTILHSITENTSGKPVFAQMIGQEARDLVRIARLLQEYPVAGVDINLGCPAPIVCRKDAGGGLLRKEEKLRGILGALREAVTGNFTVKTRVGYESDEEFASLLELFQEFDIDALAVHARTVKERYQTPVHPDRVKQAVAAMACPVIANGNVVDVATGRAYQKKTGATGLMIGRGAIRNPWIFDQLRQSFLGGEVKKIVYSDLLEYTRLLFEELASETHEYEERKHVNRMKKYMVYIAQGLHEDFEFTIRRAKEAKEFHTICNEYLSTEQLVPESPPENSKLFCGFGDLLK